MDAPPMENGAVHVEDGKIVALLTEAEAYAKSDKYRIDRTHYSRGILMPGLVNVHTHLDYTLMRGLLEDIEFFPWIRELTLRKAIVEWEDWVASATIGAAEALSGGVTTIGDCTDSGAAFYGAKALGLRGRIYQEVFGIDPNFGLVPDIVAELSAKVEKLQAEAKGTHLSIGISPHAPYTVRGELLEALAEYAREKELYQCIHAAESGAEGALFRAGTGGIAEMFARRGIEWKAPGQSTVAYLEARGSLSPRTMLVHGVGVSASDRFILSRTGTAWAHCPKSNAKLGNGVAPLSLLRGEEGLNPIGIGSDSVASNNSIDLFEEMRFAVLMQRASRRKIGVLNAQDVVEMATLGGARALGLEAEIGSLTVGKRADLCVVRIDDLHSIPAYDPYNALVYASRASDVISTWVEGVCLYDADMGGRENWERHFLHTAPALLTDAKARLLEAAERQREWRP